MKYNYELKFVTAAAKKIKLLLLDVDGILTNGQLYFSDSGEESKAFHSLDGHGIKMLMSVGIDVGIITGRKSKLLEKRAADLGIKLLYQGREDKLNALDEITEKTQIDRVEIAYAGDDFPDLPVLKAVGLSFSVAQGHADVRAAVHVVTATPGGSGAVREMTDFILQAQGRYQEFLDT